MFFHILKNDLKRKKTMNFILFVFIVLAATFVASGLNNVVTVMNGTDYFLDRAGIGDFVIVTMGENAVGSLDEMLETEPEIKGYRKESVVYGSRDNVTMEDGSGVELKNAVIFQSPDHSAVAFFDRDNREITGIEKGHAYVTRDFLENNNLQEGDVICLKLGGVEISLVLDGRAKDALFGTELLGNTRFLLSDADMELLLDKEEIREYRMGEICYIDTDDAGAMSSAMTRVSNVAFSGSRSMLKMLYAMEMLVVFIMLILSVCLMIVSFVVLKFSISFTIMEEYREIGVMKAIGLSDVRVRGIYIIKYLMMAVAGAAIGFFTSIPFGNRLLESVSRHMVLGNDNALLTNFIGCVAVVCVIVWFAYLCTKRVKKASPVDAIRNGQTGERYHNKSVLRIHKWLSDNASFMAANDILSNPRRYLSVMVSFGLCMLFVLLLVNTTATVRSAKLIRLFGKESDLYMTVESDVMTLMGGGSKEKMSDRLDELAAELDREGMPAQLCIEMQYKYPVTFEGKDYNLNFQQGINTRITDYEYTEGTAPQNEYEIAITPQIAQITGAKIGDTITVHYGTQDADCMVTAYFQTMNLLGEVIRLHEDAPAEFDAASSGMSYQIDFTDQPSAEEIEKRKERIKTLYDNEKVMNAAEYCDDCTGVSDMLESVQLLLLGITLVVVILVTILMERSFIEDEKSQIAILKAVGFGDAAVIRWHVCRLGLVTLFAVILAAVLSIPVTNLCISPIFGMMGATDIEYQIEPLQIFLVYPCIVLAVTMLVTWITAMYTKTIKSSDTAYIE